VDSYSLIRPLLFALDPEFAHYVAFSALRIANFLSQCVGYETPRATGAPVKLLGLDFPNRIGLAAGADKNARYLNALGLLGFGFVEVGTMTPRPQAGRARPRMFRLTDYEAVINRMGFPNEGVEVVAKRLEAHTFRGIVGANISVNATTPIEHFVDDFVKCFRRVHRLADYVAMNVSSPNTQNLRDMQDKARLRELFERLRQERSSVTGANEKPVPILIKISPDLTEQQLRDTGELALELKVDGVIATNTTLTRDSVRDHPLAKEPGGLSGAPLAPLSLRVVSKLRNVIGEQMVIIGVGGVSSAEGYARMRDAGADLVQVYTGLVFRGPRLVRDILQYDAAKAG